MTGSSDLSIFRFIDAPLTEVWKAWSDPILFQKWWIPKPMECKVIKLELHAGGGFETLMREANNEFQPHVEGCFLQVIHEESIVFTTMLTAGWRPSEPLLAVTAIIALAPEGVGTNYSARVLHKNAADSKKHEDMGFHEGWGAAIDQLSEVAQGLTR